MKIVDQNISLDKERKVVQDKLKRFQYLSNIRSVDFPMNHLSIVENNLIMINEYHREVILEDKNYSPTLDMWLVTLIINYVSSVKSYLNRKIKKIEKQKLIKDDKDNILSIIRSHRKKGRKNTSIEQLVDIRDRFEHEEIKDISLTLTFKENGIQKKLYYKSVDLLKLFIDSFKELKEMNNDVSTYIEKTLSSLDLRYCALFMNAFNRHFNKKQYTLLDPEETSDEINTFDNLISTLAKK